MSERVGSGEGMSWSAIEDAICMMECKFVEELMPNLPGRTIDEVRYRRKRLQERQYDKLNRDNSEQRKDAIIRATKRLAEKLDKAFIAFEQKHRLVPGAGEVLLLDYPHISKSDWPETLRIMPRSMKGKKK